MKVYFTCSARGTDEYGKYFNKIFDTVESAGHKHLDNFKNDSDPEAVYSLTHEQRIKLYEESMNNLKRADVTVLELSTHSMTMGFLLQKVLGLGRPTIGLYKKGFRPAFVAGINDEKLQLIEYLDEHDLEDQLVDALDVASGLQDVRFNFFISPAIGNYLDWISKNKKTPRSVYLRSLIKKDMEKNEEYR